jgi:leucyl-tRNA synthetase
MSKSRRNTVDPSEIMATYGADTARWFMLSDSPPERDVIWTEAGVEGAHRYVQRVWRLVSRHADALPPPEFPRPALFGEDTLALRRHVHRTIEAVGGDIERLRFNRAVAHLYELTNVLSAASDPVTPDAAWVLREGLEALVLMVAPMMPASRRGVLEGAGPPGARRRGALARARSGTAGRRHRAPARADQRQEARGIDNRRRRIQR